MTTNSFIASGVQTVALSSLFTVKATASSPTYLVLTGLDRNEYTAGASDATGTLNGNGASAGFTSIGDDGRGAGIVFTLQTSSGRYYNSTYGYFDQMSYTTSASTNDVTNLSLYTTNNHSLATSDANNAYAMEQLDAAGYLGSATIATQPSFHGTVPGQATPDSIAATAETFVGKAWNMDGCWVLASTIAAESGASLPVDSSMVGVSGQANGEWIVAFDGSKQSGNWESLVKAGEIIVIGSASSGHITTCVSGSGSTAMLVDNITYVNSSGAVQNLANDGSSNDVTIAAAHLASQEWSGVDTSMVKIYELDTPVVSDLVSSEKMALNAKQALAALFSAIDPASKAITEYQVYDTAASDSLLVNGVSTAAHTAAAAVTVASLSAVTLLAGASAASDTIDVRAYNGSYWGDWQTLSVAVGGTAAVVATPTPPTVSQTAAQTWSLGQHVSFTLPSTAFSDPNGQKLSYTATLSNGQALPSWLTFQAATETFSGLVPKTASGTIELEVTATNTSGLSTNDLFYVALGTSTVPTTAATHGIEIDTGSDSAPVALIGQASAVHGLVSHHIAM